MVDAGGIGRRLAARPPYDAEALLGWLRSHVVAGVEEVVGGTYRRTLAWPDARVVVELAPHPDHLALRLVGGGRRELTVAAARMRDLGDLDADPTAVAAVLGADPLLAPLVAARPGLRVPGAPDVFELAVRAVIGQQVSLAGARTLTGRVVARLGVPLSTPDGTLTHLFPTAEALAAGDLTGLGLTGGRMRSLLALGRAVADGQLTLARGADREATERGLLALPGIGPWTAAYVAMRGLGDPDAFPSGDLALLRGSRSLGGPADTAALTAYAERWRPWRAYAAQYLWTADGKVLP